MPRWCRIHFLLFAAQLDGLKITTSSNNNKKNPPQKIPVLRRSTQKPFFFFGCFAWKNVIGRHFQETERRQRRIIGVRLIGFCWMTKFVLTTSPPTELKLAVLMGNNHETNVSLGSCPRALHTHTQNNRTHKPHFRKSISFSMIHQNFFFLS